MANLKRATKQDSTETGLAKLKKLKPVPRGFRNKLSESQAKEFDEMLAYINKLSRSEKPLMSEVVKTIISHFGITTSEPSVRREMRRLLNA